MCPVSSDAVDVFLEILGYDCREKSTAALSCRRLDVWSAFTNCPERTRLVFLNSASALLLRAHAFLYTESLWIVLGIQGGGCESGPQDPRNWGCLHRWRDSIQAAPADRVRIFNALRFFCSCNATSQLSAAFSALVLNFLPHAAHCRGCRARALARREGGLLRSFLRPQSRFAKVRATMPLHIVIATDVGLIGSKSVALKLLQQASL